MSGNKEPIRLDILAARLARKYGMCPHCGCFTDQVLSINHMWYNINMYVCKIKDNVIHVIWSANKKQASQISSALWQLVWRIAPQNVLTGRHTPLDYRNYHIQLSNIPVIHQLCSNTPDNFEVKGLGWICWI